MRIGELARRSGVSRRSLRYYEQHGLLHARRTANGWREYDEAAEHRARTVAEMLAAGLTIDGVKDLAPCLDQQDHAECDDPGLALATYRARLAVVDERLASWQRRRDALARHVDDLTEGSR